MIKRKKKRKVNFWKRILQALFFIWLIHIIIVFLFRWVPIPITPLIVIRGIEKVKAGQPIGYYKTWRSLSNIATHAGVAVICAEDQNFLKHSGFDFKAIEKAIAYNEKQKARGAEKRRGASTLSQQTAKNVFLWPGRSWIRKGLEVYFTFVIELLWGKERILEVYLNVAELGNGIYGVEAAAQQYWKTSAQKLNKEQSALIAAILPSPRKYSATKPGPYIQQRQQWILRQMRYNPQYYNFLKEK